MAKKNGRRQTAALQAAIDHSIELTLLRSAAALGESLMEHALKTDPELKTLVAQLAKARIKRALGKLGVERDS